MKKLHGKGGGSKVSSEQWSWDDVIELGPVLLPFPGTEGDDGEMIDLDDRPTLLPYPEDNPYPEDEFIDLGGDPTPPGPEAEEGDLIPLEDPIVRVPEFYHDGWGA